MRFVTQFRYSDEAVSSSLAVILPTRNRFAWLQRTLCSLEAQTYKDFVVYVSDDASTDETKDHDALSFPGLNVRWVRRPVPFGNIPDHFSALYAEATEEWIALAHDDEVYASVWLETLVGLMGKKHLSGLPTVMAFGATVVIDVRQGAARYYEQKDRVPEGVYTAEELKRLWLFQGCHFPGNGFVVSKSAAMQVGPMNPGYEQFDFEWMMRVAGLGVTAVSERLVNTYMLHPQNTVGSARYLRRYFDQKNPSVMELEWLETLVHVPTEDKIRRRLELKDNVGRSRFRTFLKAVATGNRELCRDIFDIVKTENQFSRHNLGWAQWLMSPIIFCIAQKALMAILALQQYKAHASLRALDADEKVIFAELSLSVSKQTLKKVN